MKHAIRKSDINKVFNWIVTIIILYCFLFNPPFAFLPVGLTKFIYILALPFFFRPKINKLYKTNYLSVTLLMLLYIFYTSFVHFTFSSQATYLRTNCLILFESFFSAYVIAYFLVKYYKEKADSMVLWTTILASIVTLVLIISPNLNAFVRESLLVEQNERLRYLLTYRGFGIADDLLYTYSIVLSVGLCLCMQYARKNMFYYAFILLFVIGIFFNARIGMIPIVIYLAYIIFIERKFAIMIKISLAILLIVIVVLQANILGKYENTVNWIIKGFAELGSLIEGDSTGTFYAMSKMIIVPDKFLELLLGTGKDIFLEVNNSDIGYILQLNYGGIIYVMFFFFIVLLLYAKLKKYNMTQYRWFNHVFLGTFLICNIKGYFFFTCSGVRMLMLMFFVYMLISAKLYSPQNS